MALVVGIFPRTLEWAADVAGVAVPLNLVFFVSVFILFLVCIQHSSELTELDEETRTLAEQSSLLELRIRLLENQIGTRARSEDQ